MGTQFSQRAKDTFWNAIDRNEKDYLTILNENPSECFGEYDNVDLIIDMVKRGLLKWKEGKVSKITSMFTILHPELTDMGRTRLSEYEAENY